VSSKGPARAGFGRLAPRQQFPGLVPRRRASGGESPSRKGQRPVRCTRIPPRHPPIHDDVRVVCEEGEMHGRRSRKVLRAVKSMPDACMARIDLRKGSRWGIVSGLAVKASTRRRCGEDRCSQAARHRSSTAAPDGWSAAARGETVATAKQESVTAMRSCIARLLREIVHALAERGRVRYRTPARSSRQRGVNRVDPLGAHTQRQCSS
jgi:hypothetical protein